MASKKTVIELQNQAEELSEALRAETEAHGKDLAELEELRGRAAAEEQRFQQMQEALRQERADLSMQAERLKEQKYAAVLTLKEIRERQRLQLAAEAEDAREALKREIAEERARARDELLAKVQSFSDNYGYYLSQLKLMMDLITKAATNTGKVFLTADSADTETLFRSEMSQGAGEAAGLGDAFQDGAPAGAGLLDETTEG